MTYDTKREQALLSLLRAGGEKGLTLKQIADALTPDGKGKSTVFRLLSRLTEQGTVRKLPSAEGRHFIYQYTEPGHCTSHLHLKCVACGRYIHLTEAVSALLRDALARVEHCTLDGQRSLLYGRCEACKGGGGADARTR